jgi:hypothetical protein
MVLCRRFEIYDEVHAESQSHHDTFESAITELKRMAQIPWDQEPNQAPCTSWKTCGRRYEIIEYDITTTPERPLRRVPALEISAQGVVWDAELGRA